MGKGGGSQFFKQRALTHPAHLQQRVEGMEAESLLQMVVRGASVLGPWIKPIRQCRFGSEEEHAVF